MSVEVNYGDSQTYYITRDSSFGKLSPKCDLWWLHPLRNQVGLHVAWVAGEHAEGQVGHLGEFDLEMIRKWFGTVPDTDRELLVAERGISDESSQAVTQVAKATTKRFGKKAVG